NRRERPAAALFFEPMRPTVEKSISMEGQPVASILGSPFRQHLLDYSLLTVRRKRHLVVADGPHVLVLDKPRDRGAHGLRLLVSRVFADFGPTQAVARGVVQQQEDLFWSGDALREN